MTNIYKPCLWQDLYGNMPRVRTPRIVWAHTSRRVLTMEWVNGVKLTDKACPQVPNLHCVMDAIPMCSPPSQYPADNMLGERNVLASLNPAVGPEPHARPAPLKGAV